VGSTAFRGFLTAERGAAARGVRWGTEFATWDELLARGRALADRTGPGRAFIVDPTAGLPALAALFAVATVPDTTLLWAEADTLAVARRDVAPALSEIEAPVVAEGRSLWGVCTSGSSGTPKVAIGYADLWELIAVHYQATMYRDRDHPVVATCLPLQFSAAFFMTVLPSMFMRHDLVIFPAHDWSPVLSLAASRDLLLLGVPALAAAACLGMRGCADMRRARLFLGGGHVSAERVALIRDRFEGVALTNLYGTAETGAIAMDDEPGHNEHVGRPIAGKAVWLRDPDAAGIGAIAAAGPDCCRYVWRPGDSTSANDGYVASTDYGRFDPDGNLRLEGRLDGGEKFRGVLVYPRNVERHLLRMDGVTDARVLVCSDANGLDHLLARVVGRRDATEVQDHCAVLPDGARPTRIECIQESQALDAYSANGKL
jgi:acyl-CoA synthetase (AMP-forming)/AMP-acid ligase II